MTRKQVFPEAAVLATGNNDRDTVILLVASKDKRLSSESKKSRAPEFVNEFASNLIAQSTTSARTSTI